MLKKQEIMDRLRHKAAVFRKNYADKNFLSAMWQYRYAVEIVAAVFSDDEEVSTELFGSRENESIDGLFPREQVMRAWKWCIDHNCTTDKYYPPEQPYINKQKIS